MADSTSIDPEGRLGTALEAWVGAVVRRPLAVVVLFALASAASLAYAAVFLGIEGSTEALFPQDLPFKRAEQRYYSAFPAQYENLFIVVDAGTPERAGQAAEALAERLRTDRQHFRSVFLPGGGRFFEENAFLYLDTDELEDLADRLAEAQPYLAELSRDGTLRGLASILARGSRAMREGDVSGNQLAAIFERFAEALDARVEGRAYHLSWAEVIAARDFEGDPRRRVILVQPVLRTTDIQPARQAILAARSAVAALSLEDDGAVQVRITGDVALSFDEMEVVRSQATVAGVASFLLVGAILFAGLRSTRQVFSTLATLLVGLVLTAGFTAVAIGHFNMISVSFAVLFIGLGVDFGIHLCMRYRELMAAGSGHEQALRGTAKDVGSSLVLCAVTTAIGFFAFVPTDFLGVGELGLISGAGMIISLFTTLTLLPALLSLGSPPTELAGARFPVWTGHLVELPVRFPRVVRGVALVLGLASVLLLPKARFDHNPLNVRDPSSESVRTLRELLEEGGSSPWSLNAIAPDLASAQALAKRLRKLDTVDRVVTVSDFVPAEQGEKLSIIEDLALFLTPLESADGAPHVTPAEQLDALHHLRGEVRKLARADVSPLTASRATALGAALDRYFAELPRERDVGASLAALQSSLLETLPEQLRILESALSAGHVTLENLPQTLLSQMMTRDGRVRVQITPSRDLGDHAALAEFVDSVKALAPNVSGSAAEMLESGRTVVTALRQALLSALVAVALVVFLLWRRVTDTALVLIPLALASSFTVAAAVLLEIPFNFADIIVLPLLLGIGVDSAIHLVHRARVTGDVRHLLATSTARAVAYSALTTVASFGTMGFSSHLGLATLGQLLTLGVGFVLLSNLTVLPALILLRPRDAREPSVERSGI